MSNAERVKVRPSVDGHSWYYTHQAANGETLETSEMFPSQAHAVRGGETAHPGLPVVVVEGDQ